MGKVLVFIAALLVADAARADIPAGMAGAQVIFLGEVHDNPVSHERQAALVRALRPKALVFEMLTEEQASLATAELRKDGKALGAALGWETAGWPDFSMYYPIFEAAPDAMIFGAAVPREATRGAMQAGVSVAFGPDAAAYGLTEPLGKAEQAAREAFQFAAHCEALPEEMLAGMVDLQRLRDASLARAAVRALDETGGPVAVITGNGHARKDWGASVYLGKARPEVAQFSLGLVEPGGGEGVFDAEETVPEAQRDDPCEAFRKK